MLPDFYSSTALFPLNGPAWSLFFELVINVAFAVLLYRLASSILVLICVIAGLLCLYGITRLGHADVGMYWSNAGLGFFRVSFSFPFGVLLARLYGSTQKFVHHLRWFQLRRWSQY